MPLAFLCLCGFTALFSMDKLLPPAVKSTLTLAIVRPLHIIIFRLIITFASAILIANGEGNFLLENEVAVFVGEVSYAWYLVHWPVVCFQRTMELNKLYDYPLFIALSFVLAVIIHFSFERLKWNYYTTFMCIFILTFGSMCMYVPLSAITPRQIAEARRLSQNYHNLTTEEIIKLNMDLYNLDIPLLSSENCTYEEKPLMGWQGFCKYDEPFPRRGNNTLMVIGNSWAANVREVVYQECSPYAKNITFYSVGGCDVLPDVIKSCKLTPRFVEYVERVQPDVLFIISRAIDLKHVDDGMFPLEDSVFTASLKKLEALELYVKKKIFILNAFDNIHPKITFNVNNYLKNGEPHPKDNTLDTPIGVKVARLRTEELVRRCKKCELMDYVPWFSINNRVTLYDPEKFVTFANSVIHFTLAGKEKIRPMYKEICKRFDSY